MPHVVLLGDSIFDNRAYVTPRPEVITQLRGELEGGWTATLLAVDGHVTNDVLERQLARLPADATHLVLSVGGNDALGQSGVLNQAATTVGEAVAVLDQARAQFREDYHRALDAMVATGLPAAVCTIYDANYPAPQGTVIASALSLFNDVITRAAFARGFDLIDLRLICSSESDYANPIEPSATGGEKIARTIAAFCHGEPSLNRQSKVWIGRHAERPSEVHHG